MNDELLKNNAGFVSDVSDDLYDYFEEKIVDSVTPDSKKNLRRCVVSNFTTEEIYAQQ